MEIEIANLILQVIWIGISIVFLYIIFIIGSNIIQIQKEKNDIKAFEIHVTTPNDIEVSNILNKLIEEALQDYVLLNRGFKRNEESHINSKEEKKIINSVSEMVSNRISPILMDKLNFYYSETAIPEIIGTRVYIRVMSYVIDNNKMK